MVGGGSTGRETLAGGGPLAKFEFEGGEIGGGATAAVGEKGGAKVGGAAAATDDLGGGEKDEATGGGVGAQVSGADGAFVPGV